LQETPARTANTGLGTDTMGNGGGSGIRTHDTVSRIHAFQASAFSHSAIPPRRDPRAGTIAKTTRLTRRVGGFARRAKGKKRPEASGIGFRNRPLKTAATGHIVG
jgi:hypothetical protein